MQYRLTVMTLKFMAVMTASKQFLMQKALAFSSAVLPN
jgi:hypothetical protein